MARLKSSIAKAAAPVRPFAAMRPEVPDNRTQPQRLEPLPTAHYEELEERATEEEVLRRKTSEFVSFEVTSSKGKKYKVTVPASYYSSVPRVWKWDACKYQVADMIACGYPITRIVDDPTVGISSRMTVYAWLEHPEFREHVDALTTETGFASQRERIAGLSRLTQKLFDKLMHEIGGVKLTDKSIGAIITGVQNGMKHLAQEKGEFIEHQHVQQETNLTGQLAVASVKVDEVLATKTDEERAKLEEEFARMGDDIIRSLTGGK